MFNRDIKIRGSEFELAMSENYDLAVCVVGYEKRSSFCPLRLADRARKKIALRYTNRVEKSLKENEALVKKAGYECIDLDASSEAQVTELILIDELRALNDQPLAKIVVDVSSMSRKTLAGVFVALMSFRGACLDVTFCYANAAFEPAPHAYPPAVVLDTVSSAFGGAPRGADKPTALVMGIGIEKGRALAAYDQLEAQAAWTFFSAGNDTRYETYISAANKDLLDMSSKITTIRYDVNDPFFLYIKLRSLIEGIKSDYRVVIVPLGAKIFALVTFLVAVEFFPDISVWRMSAGAAEPTFHRVPTGKGSSIKMTLARKPAA